MVVAPMEPQTRVELVTIPWQGIVLPLNYCDTRPIFFNNEVDREKLQEDYVRRYPTTAISLCLGFGAKGGT